MPELNFYQGVSMKNKILYLILLIIASTGSYYWGRHDEKQTMFAYLRSDEVQKEFQDFWQNGFDASRNHDVKVVADIFRTCNLAKVNKVHCADVLQEEYRE